MELCSPDPAIGCRPLYTASGLPDVTLADLASFAPAGPSLTSEPVGGVGIVGMPTNLITAAETHHVGGTILGYPVTVRFTPASYLIDYGDGATQEVRSGGASWATLRQAEFTPTPTSHAYLRRGTYGVTATVRYAAAVDFGTGWRPVAGFVERPSATVDVRIVEARTGLVQRTCDENPSGPGCH